MLSNPTKKYEVKFRKGKGIFLEGSKEDLIKDIGLTGDSARESPNYRFRYM
jgi:hypothetical protein